MTASGKLRQRQLLAESDSWGVLPQSSHWHPGPKVEPELAIVDPNSPCRPLPERTVIKGAALGQGMWRRVLRSVAR